jgi:hypothetical protein
MPVCLMAQISHTNKLSIEKQTADYNSLQQTLLKLSNLGYRQMPADMQAILLKKAQGTTPLSQGRGAGGEGLFEQDKSLQYISLSENLFPELESSENSIAIGNTTLDIQSQKIASINTNENLIAVDPITFALTIDPLAGQNLSMSPYNAMDNDPINKIDPDGKDAYVTHEVFAPSVDSKHGESNDNLTYTDHYTLHFTAVMIDLRKNASQPTLASQPMVILPNP